MVSKHILDFLHHHDGLCICFKIATHADNCIIIGFADPWKHLSFDYALDMKLIDNDWYIEHILDVAEIKLYGDKEETQ